MSETLPREVDYLKSIEVKDVSPNILKILNDKHDPRPNLWNILCLLSNRYTIYDGIDYTDEVRDLLLEYSDRTDYDLGYLKAVVTSSKVGLAFGVVDMVSVRYNMQGYWEVGIIGSYNSDVIGNYHGNGLTAFKRAVAENSSRFRTEYGSFYIDGLEIIQL